MMLNNNAYMKHLHAYIFLEFSRLALAMGDNNPIKNIKAVEPNAYELMASQAFGTHGSVQYFFHLKNRLSFRVQWHNNKHYEQGVIMLSNVAVHREMVKDREITHYESFLMPLSYLFEFAKRYGQDMQYGLDFVAMFRLEGGY